MGQCFPRKSPRPVHLTSNAIALAAVLVANTFIFGQRIENAELVFIYALANLVILGLSRAQRRSASARDGWRYLTVSLAEWLTVTAVLGMTGLFFYISYFVGSARINAKSQMIALQFLIAGFSIMSAFAS
jgi:hypothetical protein